MAPVVPNAYYCFMYDKKSIENYDELRDRDLRKLIKTIIKELEDRTSFDLVNLTHSYSSWLDTWKTNAGGEITKRAIQECHKKIAENKNGFIF